MPSLTEFKGGFGDFETLFHDLELEKYIFCSFLGDDHMMEKYSIIVGYTVLPYDILLHVVDVQDTDEENFDLDDHIEKYGVEFIMLKDFIGKYGAEIHRDYQFGSKVASESD